MNDQLLEMATRGDNVYGAYSFREADTDAFSFDYTVHVSTHPKTRCDCMYGLFYRGDQQTYIFFFFSSLLLFSFPSLVFRFLFSFLSFCTSINLYVLHVGLFFRVLHLSPIARVVPLHCRLPFQI